MNLYAHVNARIHLVDVIRRTVMRVIRHSAAEHAHQSAWHTERCEFYIYCRVRKKLRFSCLRNRVVVTLK